MTQVLGIVDPYWKGLNVPAVPDSIKAKLAGFKNTPIVYGRKVGRAVTFEASEVEMKVMVEKGKSIKSMFGLEEGELVLVFDTGQTITAPEAFIIDSPELSSTKGGEVTLKFSFGEWTEVVA